MSEKFQTHTVQNIIGYNFKNPSLLVNAFTHPSASKNADGSYVGLCFLGKAVCELLIRDYFYSNFMKLETVNISVSNAESRIAPLIKRISDCNGLTEYLILSGSATALRLSHTVETELFFALVGAIYKDGGMPSVRAFVLPKLRAVISDDDPALMREAKKDIIKKSGNERDIFSDNSDTKEKRSASSALKNLFSSKKRKNDSAPEPIEATFETKKPTVAPQEQTSKFNDAAITAELKQRKPAKQSTPAQVAAEVNGACKEPADGNYKSALQEYVQKNIRSATVMLEYRDVKSHNGCVTEIYLFGKKIAKSDGANKKEASQNAANLAYHAITASNGEAADWFNKLKADPENAISNAPNTTETDYISELNRIYQKKLRRSDASVKYENVSAKNAKLLAYTAISNGALLGYGEGKTAREAKQNAAKNAISMLEKNDNINFRKRK